MKFRLLSALFAVLLAPGCVMVQIGVTNPIPGLSTVAIAPFLNLSAERAVDGRRFALAYASELQKVPGFEVIPVGVTEIAMTDAKIDLNDADDVLKLAKTLRVDAVVVGAVTEYSPYYPPRIGMQVNWYSPRSWSFYPGIQTEPAARCQLQDWDKQRLEEWRDYQKRLDDAAAPETPVWKRMYRCFQRWPGIRTLYGEPSLAWKGTPCQVSWRAQSPASDEPDARAKAAPDGGWVPANREDEPSQSAHEVPEAPRLVKVAHYQELEGMSRVVRLVTADDRGVGSPATDSSQPPSLLPLHDDSHSTTNGLPPGQDDPADSSEPGAKLDPRPSDSIPPMPLPGESPIPPAPRSPNGTLIPPGLVPDSPPFDHDPPSIGPFPFHPEPPGSANGSRSMKAIRDPALTPPQPQPNPYNVPQPVQPWQMNPHLPLMAYTRMFDGADADLVAALRDYVELNGDLRSGGWEGYLHRSDDFIRFASYRMILEMLSLHGGEGKHRMIFKLRKYR